MSSRRTLFVFVGIFGALLVALAIQDVTLNRLADTPASNDTQYQRTFPDISSAADIQAVRLADPSTAKTFTIAQQAAGVWTAPDSGKALRGQAGIQIATTIALLPNRQVVPILDEQALTTYGFKPNPLLLIYVLLKNGKTHNVAIGSLTPATTSYYAIVDDVSGVYVLDRSPIDFLIVALRTPPVA